MIGDCPNFAVPGEQNGTVPFSEIILLDALKRHRLKHRRGFTLTEVFVASSMLAILSALLTSMWTGMGKPLLTTAHYCQIDKEAHLALTSLAQDLGGMLPEGTSGDKLKYRLVGKTLQSGSELWLCFDGGDTPNKLPDWASPDVVIIYHVVDNSLIRLNQTAGTEFIVAHDIESLGLGDLGTGVEITMNFACHGVTQSYDLVAKNP
jgi:prepilin-type N-terminal cleavage/methylation domain-containing protein